MRLHCPVRGWAIAAGERVALEFGDLTWTYRELDSQVSRWAVVLRQRGVSIGSRVAIVSANRPELVCLAHAVARLGATLAPLNARLTAPELEPLIERLAPSLAIWGQPSPSRVGGALSLENLAEAAAELPPPVPFVAEPGDAPQAILFTSGTTGFPKGAMLTRHNFLANAKASAENVGGDPQQRWLACLPLYHVGGLAMLVRTACYGARLILHPRFDAQAVTASLAKGGVTHLSLVENALAQLLDCVGDKPTGRGLRAVLVGGGPVAPELMDRARAAGLPVLHTYGLTEATSQVTTERPGTADGRTAGSPLNGVEVRIVDGDGLALPAGEVGEIEVRGPTVMRGYFQDAPGTAEAFRSGWLRTRDLGTLDAAGRLLVFSRRTDLIVSGGENIYPAEIERALASHPAVAEVAIVGQRDARWGQVPVAALVLRCKIDVSSELPAWLRAKLAPFKLPRRWLTLDALPRNATGKVDRLAVRSLVERAVQVERDANLEGTRQLP